MKTTIRSFVLLSFWVGVALSWSMGSVRAQESDKDEEAILEKIVYDFASAYSKITETKDKGSVLKHVSRELNSMILTNTITDRVKVLNSDFSGFVSYLDKVSHTSGLKVGYEVKDIVRNYAKNQVGVTVYTVDYKIEKDGELWTKGHETVTMTFKKMNEGWKIVHYTVIQIEDEKLKGNCLCEVFGSGRGDYVAKTTVPSGRNYNTELLNFEFRNKNGGTITNSKEIRYVNVGSHAYEWRPNGEIWVMKEGSTNPEGAEQIGKVKSDIDEVEVISMIVKNHLFKENCGYLKVKR